MRIGVFTDVHANLPAARAAVDVIRCEGVDLIVHTGDAVSIGPQPAETLGFLLAEDIILLQGNHEISLRDDTLGTTRFVSPGSAGCTKDDRVHFGIVTLTPQVADIEFRDTRYDRSRVIAEFEHLKVPGRESILRIFFGVSGS